MKMRRRVAVVMAAALTGVTLQLLPTGAARGGRRAHAAS